MKSVTVPSLVLAALALSALTPIPSAAQYYDDLPVYDDGGLERGRTETFIDEFGRQVTVDDRGRIIGVEQPRRRGGNQLPGREALPLEDGDIVLEGPVDAVPGVDPGFQPRRADPRYDDPIDREALPQPGYDTGFPDAGDQRNAGLPGDGGSGSGADLPEAGAPII